MNYVIGLQVVLVVALPVAGIICPAYRRSRGYFVLYAVSMAILAMSGRDWSRYIFMAGAVCAGYAGGRSAPVHRIRNEHPTRETKLCQ